MTWERERVQKSLACNAELVRHYRKARGLTQKQLSETSGYCVRVISKIEAGSRVLPDVIATVAKALSCESQPIHPEDLIAAPVVTVATLRRRLAHQSPGRGSGDIRFYRCQCDVPHCR